MESLWLCHDEYGTENITSSIKSLFFPPPNEEKEEGATATCEESESSMNIAKSSMVPVLAMESNAADEDDNDPKILSASCPEKTTCTKDGDEYSKLSFPERYSISIARHPALHLSIALSISLIITAIVIIFGNLNIQVGSQGFLTRGTLIADRSTQVLKLRDGGNERRVLADEEEGFSHWYCKDNGAAWYESGDMLSPHEVNLNSVWKTKSPEISALNGDALYELCIAEVATLQVLEERDLCYACPIDGTNTEDGSRDMKCLQPYSLVALSRLYLNFLDGVVEPEFIVPSMSCNDIRTKWTYEVQKQFTSILMDCTSAKLTPSKEKVQPICFNFNAEPVVDELFLQTGIVQYTSSIYATKSDISSVQSMYNAESANLFSRNVQENSSFEIERYEAGINSLYTTGNQGFYELYLNDILPKEAAISLGALVVTSACILLHTKSAFLTLCGLLQIILALPWAYFVYYFILGFSFFPFINAISLFIVFALGADDIFVVVDKFKMKREQYPNKSLEEIARQCFPDAAFSIFVTSITTSVAFFASSVIKIPAVGLFAIYCGLVVALDYFLCIVLIFPALCLNDRRNKCRRRGTRRDPSHLSKESCRKGRTYHVLSFHYNTIHKLRYPLLFLFAVIFVLCGVVSSRLGPPDVPDPPFLPKNNRYEVHRRWSAKLLSYKMALGGSGLVSFVWGLEPTDTGNMHDPGDTSKLVFDSKFNPRLETTQLYLLDVCERVFGEISLRLPEGYRCPMQDFDKWLKESADNEECGEGASVPVRPDLFDSCINAYREDTGNSGILLHENGSVAVITLDGYSNTTQFSQFGDQKQEWQQFETWYMNERLDAPEGTGNFFYSSLDFWVYDTLRNSMSSALASALIALCCASIMVLMTSLSFTICIFTAISIGYVIVASTACLVLLDWTLGMFESILFSILIGIGVDYVLHFGHSYSAIPGIVCKEKRTHHALTSLGPSVIGSAFTTLSAAIIMLFAENVFIHKFGVILIMTIVHSMIGSFIVFMLLCDCFGPSQRFQFPSLNLKPCCNILSSNEKKGKDSVETKSSISDKSEV